MKYGVSRLFSKNMSIPAQVSDRLFHAPKSHRETEAEVAAAFKEQLNAREEKLIKQINRWKGATAELQQEQLKLQEEKEELDQHEADLSALESEIAEHENRMTHISEIHKSAAEIEKDTTNLHKAAEDLQQQLLYAERELQQIQQKGKSGRRSKSNSDRMDETADNDLQKDEDEEHLHELELSTSKLTDDSFTQKVQKKSKTIHKLGQLIETLQRDILSRESDIINLEIKAMEHQNNIEAAKDFRAELVRRKAIAEQKNSEFMERLTVHDQERKMILEEREEIQKEIEEAEKEKNKLNQIEIELQIEEENIELKRKRRIEIEEEMKKQNERILKIQEERRKKAESQLELYQQERDEFEEYLADLDNNIEKARLVYKELEQAFNERQVVADIESSHWTQFWAEKNRNADQLISTLERKISQAKSVEVNRKKLEELIKYREQLEQSITNEKNVINESQSEKDEIKELSEIEKQLKIKDAKLRVQEDELDAKNSVLVKEEIELEEDDEDAKQKKVDMELKMKVLSLREASAKRILETYKQQLADLQDN